MEEVSCVPSQVKVEFFIKLSFIYSFDQITGQRKVLKRFFFKQNIPVVEQLIEQTSQTLKWN